MLQLKKISKENLTVIIQIWRIALARVGHVGIITSIILSKKSYIL